MEEDAKRKSDAATMIPFILMISMAETLKSYYNQHRATGCQCSLCKEAERAFRRINMNPREDIKFPAPLQVSRQLKALATTLLAPSRTPKKHRREASRIAKRRSKK